MGVLGVGVAFQSGFIQSSYLKGGLGGSITSHKHAQLKQQQKHEQPLPIEVENEAMYASKRLSCSRPTASVFFCDCCWGIQSQLFEKWLYGHLVSKIFGGKMKMMGLENFGKNRLIIWCPTGRRRTIDGSKLAPVGKISGLRLCV
jgi:hypothetical protein